MVGAAPSAEAPIEGRLADAFQAAYVAADACTKLIKAGNTNTQVTQAMEKVAQSFDVALVKGTVMHQMKRYVHPNTHPHPRSFPAGPKLNAPSRPRPTEPNPPPPGRRGRQIPLVLGGRKAVADRPAFLEGRR